MLRIDNVNHFYGESHTLWDVTLDVEPGQCTCLMGRNGVGKTTLLKAIMGLVRTRSGQIVYGETNIAPRSADLRAHIGIGYVPQGRDIFPRLTVEENLRIGLFARTGAAAKSQSDASVLDRIYSLFPVLAKMGKRRGGDLSGGQQQQLAIGRALAIGPKLLILDEPAEGIQPNVVTQIGDVLLQLRDEGLTILLVEQKLPFAKRVAQRFSILDRGRAVAHGPMTGLTDDIVARYLAV